MRDKATMQLSDETEVRRASAPYQRDFPYEREEEAQVARREFCRFLGFTSAALFLSAAGFALESYLSARREQPFQPQHIAGAEDLAPGEALNFRYPTERDSAILVHAEDGSFYAYGQKCTHLSCPVYYERGRGRLECPCHEGAFDLQTGRVLYGPPPRPLDRILLEVRDDGVWAVGRKAQGEESFGERLVRLTEGRRRSGCKM
ncbi:Rieske (2Fe-2S) protein [Pyrinomonas sp.]|uniref:QcrA and Rieske domain-containing protein n=1 Tax=Pyrinomonas sp. TaxID=2080306 RepID=UPI0033334B0C